MTDTTLTFSPADIDAVAGVSTGMQREWRRQNILPKKADRGWTRVDFQQLVWIFILKRLADAGFPLKEAQMAAGVAFPLVMGEIARLVDTSATRTRASTSKFEASDHLSWPDKGNFSWDTSSNYQSESAGYLAFSRTLGADAAAPVHVIPVASFGDVPANLLVCTIMDNRRMALAILDGVLRLGQQGADKE